MARIAIGYGLRRFTGGVAQLDLPGETVAALLQSLVARYPDLQPHLFNGEGRLRPWLRIYRNGTDIRYGLGLAEPVATEDQLTLVVVVAGGQGKVSHFNGVQGR